MKKTFKIGTYKTGEIVNIFGTDKQKQSFAKNNRLVGNHKSYILTKAMRLCDISLNKDGTYTISEIYKNPLPANFSKLNSGIYQYIAPLVLIKLLNESDENNKIMLPIIDWASRISMINHNYRPAKYNQDLVGEFLDIQPQVVSEFFERVDYSIRYYIKSCLDYLVSADVVEWQEVIMLKKRKATIGESVDGVIPIICERSDERATDEEKKYIIDCREKVRAELGIRNRSECFYGYKASKFQDGVRELLKNRDILYSYTSYDVFFTNADRCKNLLGRFDFKNEEELISNFNREFITTITSNAEKRQEAEKVVNEVIKRYRLADTYVSGFTSLLSWTVDSKEDRNIKDEITVPDTSKERLVKDFDIMLINK